MEIRFKFELNQEVFYMKDNKVLSTAVRARCYQDTVSGAATRDYYLSGGGGPSFKGEHLFATKEELLLLASL